MMLRNNRPFALVIKVGGSNKKACLLLEPPKAKIVDYNERLDLASFLINTA